MKCEAFRFKTDSGHLRTFRLFAAFLPTQADTANYDDWNELFCDSWRGFMFCPLSNVSDGARRRCTQHGGAPGTTPACSAASKRMTNECSNLHGRRREFSAASPCARNPFVARASAKS